MTNNAVPGADAAKTPVADGARFEGMHVLYVSSLLSVDQYARLLFHAPYPPSQATQKYGALLTAGLAANGAAVTAICAPPMTRQTGGGFMTHLKRERSGGVDFFYLPVLNVPLFKQLVTWITAFFYTLALSGKDACVLCYGLVVSASGGARAAARLKGLPCAVIVSDVPEELGSGMLMRVAARQLTRYDGYILLAEAMNERVNPHRKPFCVLEGQVDAALAGCGTSVEKYPEKVCLYAGMLHARYGILRLVSAFMLVKDPAARLVLYGTGDALPEILEAAKGDGRIAYRGIADNATVVEAERRATLLINPRPSDETFTKYSFPSKNLEYMASGTPVLTTRLPGMAAEYEEYVYCFDGETPEMMAEKLGEVLALPPETLAQKGRAARAFVLQNKGNVAQAGRMLAFLKGLRRA